MSELPSSWAQAPIGSVCVETEQVTPESEVEFTYIDIGSVDRFKKKVMAPQRLLGKDAPSRARKRIRAGDTIVSTTRPGLNAVALVDQSLDGQIASTGFEVLRAPGLDPRWLGYLVRTSAFVDAMTSLVQGALYPAVRGKDVRSFVAPIAPGNEQKRIADKLDTVLTRVDAVNSRLARVAPILKRFRLSVLAAATSGRLTEDWRQEVLGTRQHEYQVTEISVPYPQRITGPKSWKPHTFDQAVDLVGGSQPPKTTFVHEEQPDYVRLIQIRDYKSDRHLTYIPRALARRFCSATDVMIGRYGPPIFQILRGLEGAYNVALMKAVPKGDLLTNDYLYYWLQRDDLLKFVEAGSDRTAGQDGVRKEHLIKYPIFVPTVPEQAEIVRRVEALFAFAERLEARLQTAQTATERLTPALLAKAFRGELVTQDPNDEPASELLRRLQQEAPSTSVKRGRKSAA